MYIANSMLGVLAHVCPSSEKTSRSGNITFNKFVGGTVEASIYNAGKEPRAWEIGLSAAESSKVRALRDLARVEKWRKKYGDLHFIPTGGEKLNLLTPGESSLERLPSYIDSYAITEDGPVFGYTYSELTDRKIIATGVPVSPEWGRLSVSVYTRAAAATRLTFYNQAGQQLGNALGNSYPATEIFTRNFRSYPIPVGAVSVQLQVAGEATMPALTAGTQRFVWSEGTRAKSVVIEELDSSLLYASAPAPVGVYAEYAFRITQIGDPKL